MKKIETIQNKIKNYLEKQIELEKEYNSNVKKLLDMGASHGSKMIKQEQVKLEEKMKELREEYETVFEDLANLNDTLLHKRLDDIPEDFMKLVDLYSGKTDIPESVEKALITKAGNNINALQYLKKITGIDTGIVKAFENAESALAETERLMKTNIKPYVSSYNSKSDMITKPDNVYLRYGYGTCALYHGYKWNDIQKNLESIGIED